MQCSHESCEIDLEMLLVSIDDGKDRLVFCPNHLAMRMYDLTTNLRVDKSLLTKPFSLCDACCEQGIVMYSTSNYPKDPIHITLCESHLDDLVKLRLDESAYFNLVKKFGIFHEIHDDFYDPQDGYALQPRED